MATASQITTIDASAMTTGGALVQTARSATAASTYTGSLGDDTFIMMNKSDVLDGGAGTSDTLDINKAFVLGGIEVDLSSTTDQVTTFNGAANTAVQKGFENVDVSGVTGSFGAQVTAISTGSTITGTANADVITGGAGIDTITAGVGADTITGGAGADIFNFANGDTATPSATNFDTITDYAADEVIDWTTGNVTVNSSSVSAASGTAGLAGSGAAATFDAADTTLAEHIVAIEAALVDATHTAGEAAHWQEGSDTFVFITDGVSGVGANDIVIKLTGVDSTDAATDVATISSTNFTLS